MTTNLAIPYAKHATRGNIGPQDDQDGVGRKANVTCLGCGEPLEHRRPSRDGKRRTHYAHQRASQADAVKCFESAVHHRVKDLVASLSEPLTLPRWCGLNVVFSPSHGKTEATIQTPLGTYRRADVLLANRIGQRLVVEVCYKHPKEVDAISAYRMAQIPTLELQIDDDDSDITSADLLTMFQTRSKWLVRPFEPFESESPLQSYLPEEYMQRRCMLVKEWECLRGLTELRQIFDSDVRLEDGEGDGEFWTFRTPESQLVACIAPTRTKDTEFTFKILGDSWELSVDRNWDSPFAVFSDRMPKSLFRDVTRRVANPNQTRLSNWDEHYRRSKKGNWTSSTAVDGFRITLFRSTYSWWDWKFIISPNSRQYKVVSEKSYDKRDASWVAAEQLARALADDERQRGTALTCRDDHQPDDGWHPGMATRGP